MLWIIWTYKKNNIQFSLLPNLPLTLSLFPSIPSCISLSLSLSLSLALSLSQGNISEICSWMASNLISISQSDWNWIPLDWSSSHLGNIHNPQRTSHFITTSFFHFLCPHYTTNSLPFIIDFVPSPTIICSPTLIWCSTLICPNPHLPQPSSAPTLIVRLVLHLLELWRLIKQFELKLVPQLFNNYPILKHSVWCLFCYDMQ